MANSVPNTATEPDEGKGTSSFWWPRTDTTEHALDAARRGAWTFLLIAVGFTAFVVFAVIKGYALTAEGSAGIILTVLFVYLTWRTFMRPSILLNCIAFALAAYMVVFPLVLIAAVNKTRGGSGPIGALFFPFLALVA